MDCYFRQYWRDTRLSFKGLKNNANNLVINQLSLNVAMLEKIWKPGMRYLRIMMKIMMMQILTSIMVLTPTSMQSPGLTNCWGYLRMETSHTLSGYLSLYSSLSLQYYHPGSLWRQSARWFWKISPWTSRPVLSYLDHVSSIICTAHSVKPSQSQLNSIK